MRQGICKHYRGLVREDTCEAGINCSKLYNGSDPGLFKRIPCIAKNGINDCGKRVFPTDEEVAESERVSKVRTSAMVSAIAEINNIHKNKPQWEFPVKGKNKDASGTIVCPLCKGKLHYTISGYNGHVWGKCETDGCLGWMM